jgi:hypothetical protein
MENPQDLQHEEEWMSANSSSAHGVFLYLVVWIPLQLNFRLLKFEIF